jgi:hypothetical protein
MVTLAPAKPVHTEALAKLAEEMVRFYGVTAAV